MCKIDTKSQTIVGQSHELSQSHSPLELVHEVTCIKSTKISRIKYFENLHPLTQSSSQCNIF